VEKELEQFRQEVERLRAGRQRGSLPYPEALRAFAVRYLAHALETGGTLAGTAKALGVSEPTLQAWRKGQPAAQGRGQALVRGQLWYPHGELLRRSSCWSEQQPHSNVPVGRTRAVGRTSYSRWRTAASITPRGSACARRASSRWASHADGSHGRIRTHPLAIHRGSRCD
jgi:hypothetical protein